MANCPNCKVHISMFNWKPICKSCGINIPYFDMENRLLADAEKAEAHHKIYVRKMARIKAAYAGSKLTIARIILTVLPVGLLFLPLAKGKVILPFLEKESTYSFMTILKLLQNFSLDVISALRGSAELGGAATQLATIVLLTLLALIFSVIAGIMLFTAHSKKGMIRQIAYAAISMISFGATAFFFKGFTTVGDAQGMNIIDGSISFGFWLVLFGYALCIVINAILLKTGVNIVYPVETEETVFVAEEAEQTQEQDTQDASEEEAAHA